MTNIASENDTSSPSLMATAVKEGIFAGIVSLGMFILYVGIVTYQDINNQLIWGTRWGLLSIFVGVAAIGRFLMVGFIRPSMDRRKLAKAKSGILEISEEKGFFHKHFLKLALVLLLLYPVVAVQLFGFQGSLKFVDNFGIQILIYVMLA